MDMKNSIAAVAASVTLMLSACTQLPTDPFTGSYTFKTSGTVTVTVEADTPVVNPGAIPIGSNVFELTPEAGRMDIRASGDDTMVVSMNVLGGDVQLFEAKLTPGGFRLLPATRMLRVNVLPPLEVRVSGEASMLDGILYLKLEYTGARTVESSVTYSITASDVICVATKNQTR